MAILKTNERRVFLWRVLAAVKPSEAADRGKTATLDEILTALEFEVGANRARVFLGEGSRILEEGHEAGSDPKNQLYIADIKRDPERSVVSLLIIRGDPNAVPPAFVDTSVLTASAVRVARARPKETQAWSAHLVISTVPHGRCHRACFEQVPGVSSSLVMTAIDRLLERALARNPTYQYENVRTVKGKRTIERKRYHPTLDVERVPSEKLVDDLEKGELSRITLTQAAVEYSGPGLSKFVTRQERKIVLHTAPAAKSDLLGLVNGVMSFAREKHYETVQFGLAKLPGNMTNSPTIEVSDQDALEHLYVRAQRLTDFDQLLEQCYGEVCSHIEERMIELLSTDAGW